MPREKECYRDNLERIKEMYPHKEMLNIKEVCVFCGISYNSAKKLFDFNKLNMISVAKLARMMS